MRNIFAITYLITSMSISGALAQVDQDGPYIKTSKDNSNKIEVSSILNNSPIVRVQKRNEKIKVEFSGNKDWNFSFKLHDIQIPSDSCPQPKKIIAISDVEGEFANFRALMIKAKVIDESYNWTFGDGHLVICGDLFDRGKDVMPYIWLLYKLEEEAKNKGGLVHVILGNHDVMNMAGDLRYLDPKYPASAKLLNTDYKALIDQNTEIGKWLRSKNTVEKIGDGIYLHAGISQKLLDQKLSLTEINKASRNLYGKAWSEMNDTEKFLNGTEGPFWYRGYFKESGLNQTEVDNTLKYFNVDKIVVGHTITSSAIKKYMNGKVYGIDVNTHEGKLSMLKIDQGHPTSISLEGIEKAVE